MCKLQMCWYETISDTLCSRRWPAGFPPWSSLFIGHLLILILIDININLQLLIRDSSGFIKRWENHYKLNVNFDIGTSSTKGPWNHMLWIGIVLSKQISRDPYHHHHYEEASVILTLVNFPQRFWILFPNFSHHLKFLSSSSGRRSASILWGSYQDQRWWKLSETLWECPKHCENILNQMFSKLFASMFFFINSVYIYTLKINYRMETRKVRNAFGWLH